MKQISTWFNKAVTTFLDPDRESRVSSVVNAIQHGLHSQGQQFVLAPCLAGLQYTEQDLAEAKARVYRGALERGWSDGVLTSGEQNMARWIAGKLELLPDQARTIDFEQARKWYERRPAVAA